MDTLIRKTRSAAVYAFLGLVALLSLFPFVWMVISATNVSNEISKGRMSFGPALMENYAKFGTINSEAELKQIQKSIDRMRIKTASPDLPIKGLSGGNQQKAVLSKMLLPNPKVLILDEPTRGVDVGAKYEIYKLMFELVKQGVSIIMISSELPEVLGISDRVLVIGEGQLRGDFVNDGLTQEQVLTAALGQAAELAA